MEKTIKTDPIVAVPARNEEKRLPLLFQALAGQSFVRETGKRLPVVIVLNNCEDASRTRVVEAASRYPALQIHLVDVILDGAAAHVGTARRLAMETAADAVRSDGVILSTDADAVPHGGWVSANLRQIAEGIDLVGGLIVGDEAEEAQLGPDFKRRARSHQRYADALDRLASLVVPIAHDPWPRHHDHTGASIAVRAAVYRAVGGLPAIPFREDIAFVKRVRDAGYRIRHPRDVEVKVSARLVGRAPGGMSDCLKGWMRAAAAGDPQLVADPLGVLQRLQATSGRMPMACGQTGWLPGEPDMPEEMDVDAAIRRVERLIEQAEGDDRAA